ncbi:MAG: nucleoside 2-deoxyribosyltransferase [Halanaerobiales bacterium]|nr:nucleoside 2-deoxyribosyltransferase [Halanaerobiales bacterium]
MIRIYFAGPLFTTYERDFIEQCAAKLRQEGFEVFVPHEEFFKASPEQQEEREQRSARQIALDVFDKDYHGVSWANVLVVMLDGAQVDDGTASEIGIFTEQMLSGQDKLGIFGLSSDMRVGPNAEKGEGKGLNYFTVGAIYRVGGDIYQKIEDIITELKKLN